MSVRNRVYTLKYSGWTRCFLVGLLVFGVFWFARQQTRTEVPMGQLFNAGTKAPKLLNNDTQVDDFSVGETGFWKGNNATNRHIFNAGLAAALVDFFRSMNSSSVLEFGAGMGSYSKMLRSAGFQHVICYDGNPNTQDLTEGFCGVLDLSKPVNISKHDWILSLEVGEHIPAKFEQIFLDNLDRNNAEGVVLSWAVEGQGGTSHVNNRNNTYIRTKFEEMGYLSMSEVERKLRDVAKTYFQNTIMVFKRTSVMSEF